MTDDYSDDGLVSDSNGKAIGIDLGTTTSIVSYFDTKKGKCSIVKIANQDIVPSAVFFKSENEKYFGEQALKRSKIAGNSESLATLFKRKLKDRNDKFQLKYADDVSKSGSTSTNSNVRKKLVVVDTNIFINEPTILTKFEDTNITVVLSNTVLEELGHRQTDPNTEYQATEAINLISHYQANQQIEIVLEEGNLKLLPKEFQHAHIRNDYNDNNILSVAVKLKEKKPILLTGDQKLQIKARDHSIQTFSHNDNAFDDLISLNTSDNFASNLSQAQDDYFRFTGEEVSTIFLSYLREEAEKKLKEYIDKVVITVPANFTSVEIEATKRATQSANFSEVIVEKEPTAAAIAYGVDEDRDQIILVYDFGGGTFDVSIIELKNGEFDVLRTDGDERLGGEDLTKALVDYVYSYLRDEDSNGLDMFDISSSGLTIAQYKQNELLIRNACERAKIDLSSYEDTSVELTNLYTSNGQLTLKLKLTRSDFESLIDKFIKTSIKILDRILKDSNLKPSQIDTIILAGGTAQIPLIANKVEKFFGKMSQCTKDTQTVVAEGAGILANNEFNGSAQNGIKKRLKKMDKTIHDFGVAVKNRKFDPIILSSETLPISKVEQYDFMKDYQDSVEVEIFQRRQAYSKTAERTVDEGVDYLDKITISGWTPMRQDEGYVEVELSITPEYIIEAKARVLDNSGNPLTTDLIISKQSRS